MALLSNQEWAQTRNQMSLRATKEDDSITSLQEVPAASRGVMTHNFGRRQQVPLISRQWTDVNMLYKIHK
jgi:hypothetical protein